MPASTSPRVYRIAIIEDHLLQRTRIEELIGEQEDLAVVFSGETAPEFVRWLRESPKEQWPQLLILDLLVDRAPSVDVALVESLVKAGLHIVVLSALASPPLVRQIIKAGVTAIVGKRDSEEDILNAIRAVLRGDEWMTPELAGIIAGDRSGPS